MLIAVTALENSLQSEIDPRFGRAAYYMIINTETDEVTIHNNSDGISASNGAGTGAAQTMSEYGVKALYTGSVGPKAAEVLGTANIPYYENTTGTVQNLLDQLKNGSVAQNTVQTDQETSVQVENQPVANETPMVEPQCPGALPGVGQGMGMGAAGRGQGMGRGMGTGRSAGRGAGRGQGRGMCRR